MLSVKRVREALSVFASLLAVVAIVSALGVGVLGILEAAATNGVRADLATRPGSELALQLSQARAADPDEQDRKVRAVITSQFSSSGEPIELAIDRTLASAGKIEYSVLSGSADDDGQVAVASVPELSKRATIVDGAWPQHSGEATIQADAASVLGIAVGDRVRVGDGDAEFAITATWRVNDDMDPLWGGEPLITTGTYGVTIGPIVVGEADWEIIGKTPQVRWMIVPHAGSLSAAGLHAVDTAWSGLDDALHDAGFGASDFLQEGGFTGTMNELTARMHALDAVKPIALLMIASIALVALLELGRLLAEIRGFELELLWSRGATAGELARTTAAESALVSLLGVVLGTGVAVGILYVFSGSQALAALGAALWVVPLATVVVAATAFTAQTFRAARRGGRRDAPGRSGRVQHAAGVGVVVLVTLAAAVSVWQLQLYGSPVTPVVGGGTAVDPVTVVAPSLALVALVLLGLLAFPRIAPLAERTASRRLDADNVLAARSVARRLSLVTTPVVLVALACGQFVVAGAYAATWESSFTRTQELRAGTSTRVTTQFGGLSGSQLDRIAATNGVNTVAPVYLGEMKTTDDYASVVGVSPRAFASLAATADGAIDPAGLADTIDVGLTFPALPAGEGDLSLAIANSGFLEAPAVFVWIGDDFGQLRQIRLDRADSATPDSVSHYSAALPGVVGSGNAWHLTAVDVAPQGADLAEDRSGPTPRVDIVAVERGGVTMDLGGSWSAVGFDLFGPSGVKSTPSFHGAELAKGIWLARLLPNSADGDDLFSGPVPVVISSTLAERMRIEPGTVVPLLLPGSVAPVPTTISEVLVGIPAAPSAAALLVDIDVVHALELRSVAELSSIGLHWIGSTDPRLVGERLRQALPGEVAVDVLELDQDRSMLGSGAIALWVAAVGAALLALAALGAVVGAQLRGRSGEVVVLRAIGMGSGQQGRIRRREYTLVIAYGAAIGLAAGLLAAIATIAPLARSAVPEPYPEVRTALMFEPISLAASLAVLLLLVIGSAFVYGVQVTTQARTLAAQEVVR